MIRMHLTAEDLAEFRFAFSPIMETIASLRVLRDPSRNAFHLAWIGQHREQLRRLELAPLLALVHPLRTERYIPDFLTPPPEGPYPDFEAELDRVRSVDPQRVEAELREAFGREEMPPEARALIEDPEPAMDRLIGAFRAYWQDAIEPHWPRIRSLLEGDVMYRARRMALAGPESFFEEMPSSVHYSDGLLAIEHGWDFEGRLEGQGLVLLPLAFGTPRVFVMVGEPYQPTFCYPPRGIATLWEPGGSDSSAGLEALLGGRRVAMLKALEVPLTTTALAERVGVTPAAVSQQLAVLRGSGLVEARREGSSVYNRLTSRGADLLDLFSR